MLAGASNGESLFVKQLLDEQHRLYILRRYMRCPVLPLVGLSCENSLSQKRKT